MCSKVAGSNDAVTQKRGVAIFGTRAPAYTTRLPVLHANRNQIFLGEQHRGPRRLSPELHRTSRQSVQAIVQKMMHVHRPPLVKSFPVP
jgi:hypothetical protein